MERFCPDCNAPQSVNAKFCAGCGAQAPLETVQPAQPVEPSTQPQYEPPIPDNKPIPASTKQTDRMIIIGVIMLALGALGVGFCLAYLEIGRFYIYLTIMLIPTLIPTLISFVIMVIGLSLIMKKR